MSRKLIDAEEAVRVVRDATRPHTWASENSDVYALVERGGTLAIAALRALPGVEETFVATARLVESEFGYVVESEPPGLNDALWSALREAHGQRVEVVVRRVREEK